MRNISIIPMTDISVWQLSLSAQACATSALATLPVQGIVARPTAPNAAFAPFAAADAVAMGAKAVKRERALTGNGHRGITTAHVLGSPAWSHPN